MRTIKIFALSFFGLLLLLIIGLPAYAAVSGPFFHFGHFFDGKSVEAGGEEIAAYFQRSPGIEVGKSYLESKGFDCMLELRRTRQVVDADKILCSYSHGPVLGSGWLWLVTIVYEDGGKVARVSSEDKLALVPAVAGDIEAIPN